MGKKYILIVVLLIFSVLSCASEPEQKFDYNDTSKTLGLNVNPADNTLVFSTADAGKSKNFILYYSLSDLLLLGIDNETLNYGTSFSNTPAFDVDECNKEIALRGSCILSIMFSPTTTGGTTALANGSIRLKFINLNDPYTDKIKYHELKFIER